MAGSAQRPTPQRDRVRLSIDGSLVAWMAERSAHGTFGSDSHAVELALRRLRAEQDFIRDRCRREGVPYSAATFWQMHQAAIDQSAPNLAGRPGRSNAARPVGQRERVYASIERNLLDWLGQVTGPGGPFENPSHVVEAALRNLRAQESAAALPGAGFSADSEALWQRYAQHVKPKRGRLA